MGYNRRKGTETDNYREGMESSWLVLCGRRWQRSLNVRKGPLRVGFVKPWKNFKQEIW